MKKHFIDDFDKSDSLIISHKNLYVVIEFELISIQAEFSM